jgi:hypothetical protein
VIERSFISPLALLVLAAACSDSGGKDAAVLDATPASDAAPSLDAASAKDAQTADALASDAAGADVLAPDAEAEDAGGLDAAAPDSSIMCPDGGVGMFCTGIRIALLGLPGLNSSSNFENYLNSNGQRVTRLQATTQTSSTSSITLGLLQSYDVVILDRLVRTYSSTEARTLRNWVAGGGGLMSMSGYTGGGEDYLRPNSLLESFGLRYLPGLYSGPVTSFVPHPVTMGLSAVTFSGGYRVGEIGGVVGGMNTVTATLAAGPVEIVQERGSGRVVVWGDEWVEFDSEWQSMPMIEQFWIDVLGWLVHRP